MTTIINILAIVGALSLLGTAGVMVWAFCKCASDLDEYEGDWK